MAIDPVIPRSRRAILAAGIGGIAAAITGAIGKPVVVSAATGDNFVLGQNNSATTETVLTQDTFDAGALHVVGSEGAGAAILSESVTGDAVIATTVHKTGVTGTSLEGTGVRGSSYRDYGIRGSTGTPGIAGVMGQGPAGIVGVFGYSGPGDPAPVGGSAVYGLATTGQGVQGSSSTQAGVVGYSGPGAGPLSLPTKTGVYGYANADVNAKGVSGNSPVGTGIMGTSDSGIGVRGTSTNNTGLRGDSVTGTAVRAVSSGGRAINASSFTTTTPAVSSQVASSSTVALSAIQGFVGAGALPAAEMQTGVQGRCDISNKSIGVLGESANGIGVVGDTTNGYGVFGNGYYGVYGFGVAGVVGDVNGGTGVLGWTGVAFAPTPAAQVGVWAGAENGRTALQVSGVAKFNRSGRVSFSSGQSSKKVIVAGGIVSGAFALATLQTNRAGIYVQAVVPAVADSSITIYLNKAVTATTAVGWIVVG